MQYIFLALGVKLNDSIGARKTVVISSLIVLIGYLILVFIKKYIVVLVGMGIFGLGIGLGHLPVIKNTTKYFIKHQGLINGIISGGQAISCFVLTMIADFVVVNPNKVPADSNGIYPEECAKNLKKLLYILLGLIVFFEVMAISLTFTYEGEDNLDVSKEEETNANEEEKEGIPLENIGSEDNVNVNQENKTIPEPSEMQIIKEAFCTMKNLQLGLCCFCGICKAYF